MTSVYPITRHELRQVAVSAYCDPRAVERYLRGCPGKHTTSHRIAAALREIGRDDLVRERERRADAR